MFDRTRYGNRDDLEILQREISVSFGVECIEEDVLVARGGEAKGIEDSAPVIHESDESFGAADVDAQIHSFSIALGGKMFG